MKVLADYEYFKTANGILYHGDAADILPLITENIDLVFTDPPYNVNKPIANDNLTWDEWDVWFSNIINLMDKYKRYYFFTGGRFINKILPMTKRYLDCFILYKPYANNRGFITEWSMHDFLIVGGGKDDYKKIKNNFFSYLLFPDMSGKPHPTSKPLKAIETILLSISEEKNTVLDLFMGSGTLAVACEKLNRRWIGIEISEEYCKIAKKRIDAEANQMKLFT